jgi:hypothetical protein
MIVKPLVNGGDGRDARSGAVELTCCGPAGSDAAKRAVLKEIEMCAQPRPKRTRVVKKSNSSSAENSEL